MAETLFVAVSQLELPEVGADFFPCPSAKFTRLSSLNEL